MLILRLKKLLPTLLIFAGLLGLIAVISGYNSSNDLRLNTERCDLNLGTCEVQVGKRQLKLTLSPTPAKSLTPLQFHAEISGSQPDRVWLDIQGDEMYMGINQPEMKLNQGTWMTTTELAVCSTDKMVWRVTLIIIDSDQQLQKAFFFEADR